MLCGQGCDGCGLTCTKVSLDGIITVLTVSYLQARVTGSFAKLTITCETMKATVAIGD